MKPIRLILILIAAFILLGNEVNGNGCQRDPSYGEITTLHQQGITLFEFIGEPLIVHAVQFEPYAAHMKVYCQLKFSSRYEDARQMDVSVRIIVSDPNIDPDADPKTNESGNYAATVYLSWDGGERVEQIWSRYDNELSPYGWNDELAFLKRLATKASTVQIATYPVPGFADYNMTFPSHGLSERIDAELPECAHVMHDDFRKDPRL